MRDTDKAGAGMLIAGLLLLVFFVPVMVIVGGTIGVIWQSPWMALVIFGPFVLIALIKRRRSATR
jgi:hypothetical protein